MDLPMAGSPGIELQNESHASYYADDQPDIEWGHEGHIPGLFVNAEWRTHP
jgi:hypothetical protein